MEKKLRVQGQFPGITYREPMLLLPGGQYAQIKINDDGLFEIVHPEHVNWYSVLDTMAERSRLGIYD
jgi:hypothetical protein